MGNQQTIPQGLDQKDEKIFSSNTKVHPQKINTPRLEYLPINSPQQKMKRAPSSFELSMSSFSNFSRTKMKRKNSTNDLHKNDVTEEQSILSLQQIDNIYFYSESNLQIFFENLQEPLSKLYMNLAKNAISLMDTKSSQTDRQAKLFLCEKILSTNINIMKTLGQKRKHEFDQDIFKKFNELQKSIIGYLKAKYPKGQQNFVSGDLMNAFKSFDYIDSAENDILKQAQFYFGNPNLRDLMKKVKEFLNSLIDEVDANFPRFQRILQQKVFKTSKSSQKSLAYKINRRLPENVTKFYSVNSNSLDILSPELFRVVLEWTNDMQEFILYPDEQVDSKETLKVINEEDDLKFSSDQINSDDNYFVIKELKQKLNAEKENYQKELNSLKENMYKFQHNLIKIIEQAQLSQRYVPRKDAQIIKFAAYNTKFMSWMLAQKLTIAMKILINVGRHFKNTMMMMPLDLIKFNVTNILRATLKGSKSQLLEVYANFKKLQSEDEIKIIRLQNQLGTALNGIVLNFKMKDCFLICQVSLVLVESNHSSNEKLRNIEKLNSFFNDIQNSPYGVLSEIAEYVGYKDSRIGYENKINFLSKQFGIPICEIRHPTKIQTIKEQYEPFVCTSCSKFYGRLENTFIMKKCKQCNNFVCCKCIFAKSPSIQLNCLKEQICKYLNDQALYAFEATRGKSEGAVQGITGNTIYDKSFEKIIYIKEIKKQRKLKKMNRTQFQVYVNSMNLKNFVYGSYQKGQITLISLTYNENLNELSFGLDKNQDFYSTKRIGYNQNDFLLIYKNQITINEVESGILQKAAFINIFSKERKVQKGKYESYKINQTEFIVSLKGQKKEEKLIIDGVQAVGQAEQDLSTKKIFKHGSLKNYFEYLGIYETGRSTIKLHDLGIEKSHLLQMITLPWVSKITELNISKNKITQINEVLKYLPNLQRFTATENYIKEVIFLIKMPKLTSLVIRKNHVKVIKNIENIPQIEKMNFEQNMFETFPVMNLKELRHFNLGKNYILRNIDFLSKSILPQLSYINLQESLQNVQYECQDINNREMLIPYQELKCLILDKLYVGVLKFTSQKLQRLNLTSSTIHRLDANLQNLQYFHAQYCKFDNLKFLFHQNNENNVIKEIELGYNSIAQIPVEIKSKSLQRLVLQGNSLTDISKLANSDFLSLKYLDVSQNQISVLPKLSFPCLTQIKISANPFYNIDQFAKSSLNLIESLEFSSQNPVKSWPEFRIQNLKELTLPPVLETASLQQFERSWLPKIRSLQFQTINIKKFPVLNLSSLECLKLYYCTIQSMDSLLQCRLPNMKKLQLTYVNYNAEQTDMQNQNSQLQKYKVDLPSNLDQLQQIYVMTCRFFNIENLISKPFKNITTITVQHSNLTILPKLVLPTLKFMYFNNNKINNIQHFFNSEIPQIQEIDLSYNQITSLKKIPFQTLIILNISSNLLEKLDSIDLPNLNRIELSYNKLTQFPIIWSEKMSEMSFDGNPFKNLKNLQKCHIPNLKSLIFSQIQLQESNRICPDLKFVNIQTFSLYNTNLSSIEKINALSKLQSLSISYCTKIGDFPCLKLPELKYLYITYSQFQSWKNFNQCQIQNLTNLEINWCNIDALKAIKLPNLQDLSIQQNEKLSSVEQFFSFNKFNSLKQIHFLGNRNLVINHEINIASLRKFQLTFSEISSTKLIGSSENLIQLKIAESNFSEINLKEFRKLQSLDFTANKIIDMGQFCRKQWKNLKYLNLFENKIKQVPKMTTFPSLQNIYLDSNEIENVNDLFENSILLNLVSLFLNKNKIKKINSMKNFPQLYYLYLNQNQIQSLGFLSKLQNVNPLIGSVFLNNNKIKNDIPPIKMGIEQLQLKDNQIQSIEWLQKSQFSRLMYLDISGNRIKKLPNLNKLNRVNTITFLSNPIEKYEQFLFRQKLPISWMYISFTTVNQQSQIDKDTQKIASQYPNVNLSITFYEPNNS